MRLKNGALFLDSEMLDEETMAREGQKAIKDIMSGKKAWGLTMGWITEKIPLATKSMIIVIAGVENPLPLNPEAIKNINALLEESYDGKCYWFCNFKDSILGWLSPLTKDESNLFQRVNRGEVDAIGKFWWPLVKKAR